MNEENQPELSPQVTWSEYSSRYSVQEEGNPRAFISSDMKTTDLVDLR
jgi:hypothetical protein